MATTIEALEVRVAALEALVKAGGGGPKKAGGIPEMTPLDDSKLDADWADKVVKKDPTQWKGQSYAGCRMSVCPADYLIAVAKFHEFKAFKGRQENPPRVQTSGKPWFEQDEFMARLARTWASRNAAHPALASGFDIPF